MHFTKTKDCYRVARITGPSHNLLGLRFTDESVNAELVDLAPQGQGTRLSAAAVEQAVMRGVEKANADFSASYRVARIEFVGSDTPRAEVYESLAYAIVERLVNGGAFVG